MKTIYIGNDNVVSLSGLKNASLDAVVNNATVQLSVEDTAGNTVSGQDFPVSMNYVAESAGDYVYSLKSS